MSNGVSVGPRFATGRAATPSSELARQTLTFTRILLVGADQRSHVVGLRRGVEVELALLLGALDHFPQAVGARVKADVGRRAFALTCPRTDAGRRAPATNRLADD